MFGLIIDDCSGRESWMTVLHMCHVVGRAYPCQHGWQAQSPATVEVLSAHHKALRQPARGCWPCGKLILPTAVTFRLPRGENGSTWGGACRRGSMGGSSSCYHNGLQNIKETHMTARGGAGGTVCCRGPHGCPWWVALLENEEIGGPRLLALCALAVTGPLSSGQQHLVASGSSPQRQQLVSHPPPQLQAATGCHWWWWQRGNSSSSSSWAMGPWISVWSDGKQFSQRIGPLMWLHARWGNSGLHAPGGQ